MQPLPSSISRFVGSHPSLSVKDGGVVAGTVIFNKEAIVIDTLLYPDDTKKILRELTHQNAQINAIINTHWHGDHIMGNQFFDPSKLIAHDSCPNLMKTEGEKMLESAKKYIPGEAERLKDVNQVFPKKTFSDIMELHIGDSIVNLHHMPGHTPDSIVVYIPETRVLFAGDCVMDLPYIGYGNSKILIQSLKKILDMKIDFIIQGHGPVSERIKVQEDIYYLQNIRKIAQEFIDANKSKEELQTVPLKECLKDNDRFVPDSYSKDIHPVNLSKVYAELT